MIQLLVNYQLPGFELALFLGNLTSLFSEFISFFARDDTRIWRPGKEVQQFYLHMAFALDSVEIFKFIVNYGQLFAGPSDVFKWEDLLYALMEVGHVLSSRVKTLLLLARLPLATVKHRGLDLLIPEGCIACIAASRKIPAILLRFAVVAPQEPCAETPRGRRNSRRNKTEVPSRYVHCRTGVTLRRYYGSPYFFGHPQYCPASQFSSCSAPSHRHGHITPHTYTYISDYPYIMFCGLLHVR